MHYDLHLMLAKWRRTWGTETLQC